MKKKVYISLPISGRNIENVKRRAEVLKSIVADDYEALTPFDICPDSTLPYHELMGRDIAMLLQCQVILLDFDWRESRGCRAEYEIAKVYGLQIYYFSNGAVREEEKDVRFEVTMNLRQLEVLSNACDNYSRILCGQLDVGFETALKKGIDREYETADFDRRMEIRDDARQKIDEIKMLVWNMGRGASYGVGYDKESDILYDMHQVFRHHLWKIKPEPKFDYTIDAHPGLKFGTEPLVLIKTVTNERQK